MVLFNDAISSFAAIAVDYSVKVVHLLHFVLSKLGHVFTIIIFVEQEVIVTDVL